MKKKNIYIIGIGGIGVSAIARYYNEHGYKIYGSDATDSELIHMLQSEGMDIIIGVRAEIFGSGITFEKVIYTEAIPSTQGELATIIDLNISKQTYPESLAEIANRKRLIAVAGTHGKSTTTSLISTMMKDSPTGINAVIGTLLKEFGGRNAYFSNSDYFAIEACEYKRSFIKYHPEFLIITNIEVDHLDYYKDEEDYLGAFIELVHNVKSGGYIIVDGSDKNCLKLRNIRSDINFITVQNGQYTIDGKNIDLDKFNMQIPGGHINFDGQLCYTLGILLHIDKSIIIDSLEKYSGVWRRMESLGYTENNNLVISDYAHHPTEIKLTLEALKQKYSDKQIITIFQPHQFSRTIELIEDFKTSFGDTNILVVPNIYESRDSKEDKIKMTTDIFTDSIVHSNKVNGQGLDNTLKIISDLDKRYSESALIIIMGAGDVDNLRYGIKFQEQKK